VSGGMVLSTFLAYMAVYVLLLSAYCAVVVQLALKGAKKGDRASKPQSGGQQKHGPGVLVPGE
jgi:cytochrome bd-type quinol oxidase subunit 1